MTRTAERLSAVRDLRGGRGGASGSQVAYALYLAALTTLLLGVPVVRAVVLALAGPSAAHLLRSPGSARVVAAVCGAVLAVAAAAGPARGPVLLTPVRALLAGTDLPRRTTLRSALVGPVALLVLVAAAGATLLVGALAVSDGSGISGGSGGPGISGGAGFVVASAAFAVLAGVVWLAGQALAADHPAAAAAAAGALAAATAATGAVPALDRVAPWGWVGRAWPGAAAPTWWPVAALCVAAAAAVALTPVLLERLHGQTLLDQSRRWQAARTAASTADVATALATFRTGPRRGRRRRAVVAAPSPVRYLVRDLVGASRTPARSLVATAALVAGGLLIALATVDGAAAGGGAAVGAGGGPRSWALAAAGGVVGFVALGVFSDGFRHAAASASAPRSYGHPAAGLFALHATLPLVWGAGCAAAGASVVAVAGAPLSGTGTTAPTAVVAAVLVTTVLVAVRAYDSARGPLPLVLLAPVPSPGGASLSGLAVALWQVDAALVAVVAAVLVITTTTRSGPAAGAAVAAAVVAVVVALTAGRVRRA